MSNGAQPVATPAPSPTSTRVPEATATSRPTGKPTKPIPPKGTGKPRRLTPAQMGVMQNTGGAGVALTFDDGPHPTYTPQILAILRSNRVHAMFCVVGTQVRQHPALVAQIAREGHTLCNHSWHHEFDLGKQSEAKIRDNLNRTNNEIRKAVPNAQIKYFRQPGGMWTQRGVNIAKAMGMTSIGWTVDPQDWEKPPASTIKARVLGHTYPGAVVLLHDGGGLREGTVSACRSMIPALKKKYHLVPLR